MNEIFIPDDCWGIIKDYMGLNKYYRPRYFPSPKLFQPFQITITNIFVLPDGTKQKNMRSGKKRYWTNTFKFYDRTKNELKNRYEEVEIRKDDVSEYARCFLANFAYYVRPDLKIYSPGRDNVVILTSDWVGKDKNKTYTKKIKIEFMNDDEVDRLVDLEVDRLLRLADVDVIDTTESEADDDPQFYLELDTDNEMED